MINLNTWHIISSLLQIKESLLHVITGSFLLIMGVAFGVLLNEKHLLLQDGVMKIIQGTTHMKHSTIRLRIRMNTITPGIFWERNNIIKCFIRRNLETRKRKCFLWSTKSRNQKLNKSKQNPNYNKIAITYLGEVCLISLILHHSINLKPCQ